MSIAPKPTTITGPGNPGWLGSAHGTDATRTVTLDASKFTAGTHYPNGFIRGGTPVAEITATGKSRTVTLDASKFRACTGRTCPWR